MADLKFIDAEGEYVPAGSIQARYQVNPEDETAGEFVKRIRGAAKAEQSEAPEPEADEATATSVAFETEAAPKATVKRRK